MTRGVGRLPNTGATRVDGQGVVILSEFAGAAAELDGVILTNPYSPDDMDRAWRKPWT